MTTRVVRIADERPPQWSPKSACKGYPQYHIWFSEVEEDVEQAVSICNTCPVRIACLDYAISHGEVHGTWGGVPETDRARGVREVKVARYGKNNVVRR